MPFSYEFLLIILVVVRGPSGWSAQSACVQVNRSSIFGPGVRTPGMCSSSSSRKARGSCCLTASVTCASAARSWSSTDGGADGDDEEAEEEAAADGGEDEDDDDEQQAIPPRQRSGRPTDERRAHRNAVRSMTWGRRVGAQAATETHASAFFFATQQARAVDGRPRTRTPRVHSATARARFVAWTE